MQISDFLRGVSLFANLADSEIEKLAQETKILKCVRDAFICKEGEQASSMFIIKSGIVQIFCDDGTGGKKVLTHLKLGEYFGEMALLTDQPRNASSVALAETELIEIQKDSFQNLLLRNTAVCLSIIKTLCERLSKTNTGSAVTRAHNMYAVMGPDNSSGKSLFARNLALAMQKELGKEVLLYDPNLRDDRVAKQLGVNESSRIIDELVEREKISDIKKYTFKAPCGLLTILPQQDGLMDLRLKEFHTFSLMQTVMENFEFVVVDSSSMFTKVTKEILQNCDKIVYLISSKNVSITGLMEHFDDIRRGWNVNPEKAIIGVNHMTDDPSKESIITEEDKTRLSFEIPFCKELHGNKQPDNEPLIIKQPDHPLAQVANMQTNEMIFDQEIALLVPSFDNEPSKEDLSRRWLQNACNEFAQDIKDISVEFSVVSESALKNKLFGSSTRWQINDHVVKIVDFANRFKKEFQLNELVLILNGQHSII